MAGSSSWLILFFPEETLKPVKLSGGGNYFSQDSVKNEGSAHLLILSFKQSDLIGCKFGHQVAPLEMGQGSLKK